ncbi:MAG: dihydrolipoyl dehydrogenase [Campylobacteraceae bacterium]|nr:dihydrolipoyl dehydrogenase [Campylobacteraceae bacterium]
MKNYDLIIIGAGRASNLAVKASKLGKKVALIEKSALGGTCPNRGCVPSKLLIGYAHVARAIKESKKHFIEASIQNIDLEKIFEESNAYVNGIDSVYKNKFNENVTVYKGNASFLNNTTVKVNNEELSAKIIVIATGTRPIAPEHQKAWSSDDLFPLKTRVPKSITIVGSGFIACELANFFDAVGIKTKLLVRSNTLLKNEDAYISDIFKKEFSKNIDIDFETTLEDVQYSKNEFTMKLKHKNKTSTLHKSEALLYATGRIANTDTLELENTDIKIKANGFIKRDAFFQSSVKGVYVVGDASGEHMLQHAAAYEVNYLYKILFANEKKPLAFKYMPHAVFTDPEIASVGYTQEELDSNKRVYVSSTTNWLASAKAMSTKRTYPRTKLLVDPASYEILGCHLIGPESSTLMHQILAVMHINNDVRHLKDMLYIHPALSEAILPAAVKVMEAVNNYKEKSQA